MPLSASTLVEVRWTRDKGRGVFARESIASGAVIETVPVLVVPEDDILGPFNSGYLANYVFEWGRGTVGLALGFGSLYNHSYSPNARYDDCGRLTKVFTAVRDIARGEEVTINYNGDEADRAPVGFTVISTENRQRSGSRTDRDVVAASRASGESASGRSSRLRTAR